MLVILSLAQSKIDPNTDITYVFLHYLSCNQLFCGIGQLFLLWQARKLHNILNFTKTYIIITAIACIVFKLVSTKHYGG